MKLKYVILSFCVLNFLACKDKNANNDPLIERFIELTAGSTKMKITYGDTRIHSAKIIDTIINSPREINLMKKWILQSVRSEPCYKLSGIVTFIKGDDEFPIDFSISPQCPAFYYYVEGKPVTLKMTYQGGMYLSELLNR